jgi:hypothetical protein
LYIFAPPVPFEVSLQFLALVGRGARPTVEPVMVFSRVISEKQSREQLNSSSPLTASQSLLPQQLVSKEDSRDTRVGFLYIHYANICRHKVKDTHKA